MLAIVIALATLSGLALAAPAPAGEQHDVKFVNKCGRGTPKFLYANHPTPRGGGVVDGPLYGGIAWLDGFVGPAGACLSSGVNCGAVEFTLINPATDAANTFSSADYTLQSQGNHQFAYPMDFAYTGSCTAAPPGPCTGPGAAQCPGAYIGADTFSGTPVQCSGKNTGIVITFC